MMLQMRNIDQNENVLVNILWGYNHNGKFAVQIQRKIAATKANQKYQTIKNQFDAIHHITNPFSAFMATG